MERALSFKILAMLLGLSLFSTQMSAQNVYEVFCAAFDQQDKPLKGVQYELFLNAASVTSMSSKSGNFNFLMQSDDGLYVLRATAEGYATKELHFKTSSYPFSNEFEIQDIDLGFRPANDQDEVELGQLVWVEEHEYFVVEKMEKVNDADGQTLAEKSDARISKVFETAVAMGKEADADGQFEQAQNFYQLALLASPGDAEVTRLMKAAKDSIDARADSNMASNDAPVEEVIVFAVQIGAFSEDVASTHFENVPEFRKVRYEDYFRCFSGSFNDRDKAESRRMELVKMGYDDSWIVEMKDNQRIGF